MPNASCQGRALPLQCKRGEAQALPEVPVIGWWGLTITEQREPTVGGDWKGKLARNVEAMEEEEPFLQ